MTSDTHNHTYMQSESEDAATLQAETSYAVCPQEEQAQLCGRV